ncbi:MAG: folylpolyglutamate synthase/dihydrofolate synthase family protein [Vicinamibacterales bacterium]
MTSDPLAYLFGLEQFGIRFGLENMLALVERLDHPERAFRAVHIAGTNGKGSVSAMVETALHAAGHRAARYTSPHLIDLTERFVIDGQPVATDLLGSVVADLRVAIEGLLRDGTVQAPLTFFEVTTAAAFELFRRRGVDVGVLEVGLGGRLDATNVVRPLATAITSIALDHERYLGSTLGEIAIEKAGIIKPGVPVVIGDLAPEATRAIDAVARERGARVIHASDGARVVRMKAHATRQAADTPSAETTVHLSTPTRDYGEVVIGLRGAHQIGNALVAVRLLELLNDQGIAVPQQAVVAGLARPSWPGRLELRQLKDGREALLDAAHNPAGAAALASYLRDQAGPRLPLVFAAMRDKDIEGMLRVLLPAVSRVVFTAASNARSADPADLVRVARGVAPEVPAIEERPLAAALAAAWCASPRIVVAGSIFLLGDVMKEIG